MSRNFPKANEPYRVTWTDSMDDSRHATLVEALNYSKAKYEANLLGPFLARLDFWSSGMWWHLIRIDYGFDPPDYQVSEPPNEKALFNGSKEVIAAFREAEQVTSPVYPLIHALKETDENKK